MTNSAVLDRNSATIRKAAILIANLDTKTADALLDKMTPEQAAQVREAVMMLDEIRPHEQDEVIREFLEGGVPSAGETTDGVELDASLAQKLRSPQNYERVAAPAESKNPPFRSLCQASADALVRQLERQHPQVVAVVVAHLPAQRAADVVKRLTPKLQSDVLRRVAELDQADPEVIREIELELEQLLSGEIRAARNRDVGLSTVAAILAAAGGDQSGLLDNLANHERDFADMLALHPMLNRSPANSPNGSPFKNERSRERPVEGTSHQVRTSSDARETRRELPAATVPSKGAHRPPKPGRPASNSTSPAKTSPPADSTVSSANTLWPAASVGQSDSPIGFEELASLRDDEWAAIIAAVDPQIVLLSLTGASDQFMARISRQLSPRESQHLHKRLEQIGPVRLSDIDQAQRHVVQCAEQLAAKGVIQLRHSKGFAAAA